MNKSWLIQAVEQKAGNLMVYLAYSQEYQLCVPLFLLECEN